MTRELVKKLKILLKHPFSWSTFHYRFFLANNRNGTFYRQFASAISLGALLWIHRFSSCNTLSYHGTRKRRARPACVLLSGTSFSTGYGRLTRVRERYDDVDAIIRCHGMRDLGTEASGNVSFADTSTWSTYLPGRIARFCRK